MLNNLTVPSENTNNNIREQINIQRRGDIEERDIIERDTIEQSGKTEKIKGGRGIGRGRGNGRGIGRGVG